MQIFETFKPVGKFEQDGLTRHHAYVHNGQVNVKRYRVTIEEIVEPQEIYQERLQHLWEASKSHLERTPLQIAAKELGYSLEGERGIKRTFGYQKER